MMNQRSPISEKYSPFEKEKYIEKKINQIQQYAVVWCEYVAVIQCDACAPGFRVFECTSEEVWVSISDTIQTHFSGRIMKPTRASPTICCLFRPCFQLALCLCAVLLRRSRLTAFVPILYLSHSLQLDVRLSLSNFVCCTSEWICNVMRTPLMPIYVCGVM